MSYLFLALPVLGGIFIGYRIFLRQPAATALSKASFFSQLREIKNSISPKDSIQLVLSPREYRSERLCSAQDKPASARQSKQ